MSALLLFAALLAAAPASADDNGAPPKTDIAAPTAQGTSVDANTTMSDQEATQRLQGHHIRDTHRVKIGSVDKAPDRPDKNLQPAQNSGMQASASAPMGGAPGAGGAPGGPGRVAPPPGPDGNVTDATLNDRAQVMMGGTPTDFRSDRAKAMAAVGQAANAWNLGDFKTVVSDTNQALQADPRNLDALSLQALAYERLRDYADSEDDLKRAVAVDSSDIKNWEHLAWASFKIGKPQDALAEANEALARQPQDAAALALKAYAEDALGRRAQAAADIKAAAQLDRSFASRAERAEGSEKLCAPDEELVDGPGARRRKSGLPTWLPWVGGAMLCGLGLSLALLSALKGEAPTAEPPAAPPAA